MEEFSETKIYDKINILIKKNYKVLPQKKGDLKILYCGVVESQDYSGIIQDLSEFGEVIVYKTNEHYGLLLPDSNGFNKEIIKKNSVELLNFIDNILNKKRVDILIGQFWSHIINLETLNLIRKKGIPIFLISMDDLWMKNWEKVNGYQLGAIGIASGVDLVLTTTKEATIWYYTKGISAVYFPQASSARVFYENTEKEFDVVFVGNKYGLRGDFISKLIRRGLPVECFGSGWNNGFINHENMARVFSRSKIILGIGWVGYNKSIVTLKNRDFDALMSGALYITTYNKNLAELFEENKEIVFYKSLNECYEKIVYYLKNDEMRAEIAKNGRIKAKKFHTWEKRFEELFEKVGILDKKL